MNRYKIGVTVYGTKVSLAGMVALGYNRLYREIHVYPKYAPAQLTAVDAMRVFDYRPMKSAPAVAVWL